MTNSFASPEVWRWLIQFCIIATALLLGNVLRCKIPFLQKSLIPSALLGGALLLIFKAFPACLGYVNKPAMEIVTYHALGLGFVALALKNNRIQSKAGTATVIETGTLTVGTYLLQALVGLLISVPIFYVGHRLFYASGLLLPMGYGQGPGQALNFGKIYANNAAAQGMHFSGADFGLSIAAMGFILGSVVSVIYMNILRKKGKLSAQKIAETQINTLEDYEGKNEIPNAESIDKMSIQISLVLFVYFLVYLFIHWIQGMDLGTMGNSTVKPLLWGFNFLIGTLFGIAVKWMLNGFKKAQVVHREYINNYLLNRISGFCFDIMIVAGTAAISFSDLSAFALPLILICLVGICFTFFYVKKVCRIIYPDYPYEGFFSMFGMLTGTASNGMILLREIDPKFETPAANNLVLQNFPAIVLGFPILMLVGYAPLGFTQTLITIGACAVLFVLCNIFLFRKKIFGKKK